MSSLIIKNVVNKTGIITLNREKALNSLTTAMCRELYDILKEWDRDPRINKVLLTSKGKAFCAGGDVKYLREMSLTKDYFAISDFFRQEYTLNNLIGTMKTPLIPIINGIFMGGGVGITVHAPIRIVTEKAVFAMPETAIGLYPDVGGTYFLPRLAAGLGAYLGLTGQRLLGMDVKISGVGTHFVNSEKVPNLIDKLTEYNGDSNDSPTVENISTLIFEAYSSDSEPSKLLTSENLGEIAEIFKLGSVEEIVSALSKSSTDFAAQTLSTINKMSPTSLKITFRQIQMGVKLPNLTECLKVEFPLSNNIVRLHDFHEGVRSVLVDKTNSPTWNPSSIAEVNDDDILRLYDLPFGVANIDL